MTIIAYVIKRFVGYLKHKLCATITRNSLLNNCYRNSWGTRAAQWEVRSASGGWVWEERNSTEYIFAAENVLQ